MSPRWNRPLGALTCALIFAFGIGLAAASHECGDSYRTCNSGCNEMINQNHYASCRTTCEGRLLACNSTQRPGYGRNPVGAEDGGNGRVDGARTVTPPGN
jgi:hypothetical protein